MAASPAYADEPAAAAPDAGGPEQVDETQTGETSGAEADDWRVPAGVIVMASGVAFIVVGATIGTVAAAEYGSLDCPDDRCAPELADDMESYNALREPSGLMIGAGGVLAAIGGAFLYAAFTDRGDDIAIQVGPGSLGVRGTF